MNDRMDEGWRRSHCFCRKDKEPQRSRSVIVVAEPEKPGELPPCSENEYRVYFNTELGLLHEYRYIHHDEKETYFYHPDHLGSSSWITDQDGDAIQHLQYLPFGEQYVDQRTTGWNAMFTFSGKERDEETGYGYFGARYYDSDLSIWLSVDPLADKYPGWSPYMYCANNPIRITDPNGMEWEIDGIKYTPGEASPEGIAQNTKDKWDSMNSLYRTENGKKVIDEMNVENVTYNVSSEARGCGGAAYVSNNDGSGGTIYTNGKDGDLTNISHEIFHGYQDLHGQGGASIHNEVEANLFTMSLGLKSYLGPLPNNTDPIYESNLGNLALGKGFDNDLFNSVVNDFKQCAGTNYRGTYDNYPLKRNNQTRSLIQGFYPLVKPVFTVKP